MTDQPNDGGPAFPFNYVDQHGSLTGAQEAHPGMTLRDYFAAAALPAIISDAMTYNSNVRHQSNIIGFDEIAAKAYVAARSMLKARER